MNLYRVHDELVGCMRGHSPYAGVRDTRALEDVWAIVRLLKGYVTSQPTSIARSTIGIIENHPIVASIVHTGVVDSGRAIDGLLVWPIATQVDRGSAIMLDTGAVYATYQTTSGLDSFAAWHDDRLLAAPQDMDAIVDALLPVAFEETEVGRGLSGTEIAVRYLLEIQTGLPLGIE